jgi:16S rRNA (cytosine967-C5)-methyltransferase
MRRRALEIILRWENEGIFLSRLLRRDLGNDDEPRDRALLTELVYGPVRWRGTLDAILRAYAPRGLESLKPKVLEILRQAAYQMLFLDRIPVSAVVNEAVSLAGMTFPRQVTGFVNGLLRGLARGHSPVTSAEGLPPGQVFSPEEGRIFAFDREVFPESDPARALAHRFSHPEWLVKRWLARHGDETTRRILAAGNRRPSLSLRANTLRITAGELSARFEQAGVSHHKGPLESLMLDHHGRVEDFPGFAEGWFQVQDLASQTAGPLLDPQPGERVLDLCAAPGGKTTHIAALMEDRGEVVAVDVSRERSRRIHENIKRMGLTSVRVEVRDARTVPPGAEGSYDRVLVDAPCSNTGTLARRPEARWRILPEHLVDLPVVQLGLLRAAADLVREGGTIVYSTCSIEREENEAVVESLVAERGDVLLTQASEWLPSAEGDGGFVARLTRLEEGSPRGEKG